MKQLRKQIKKEIKTLMEAKYPAPPEILGTLKNTLKLNPLIRYIKNLKAVNSIPPSYEVFLHNNQSFNISYLGKEEGNFKVKIKHKEYDLLDYKDLPLAIDDLNDLLTSPVVQKGSGEEGGAGGEEGGAEAPPGEEPAEELAEEPAA